MSLENNLKRIADALEKIAAVAEATQFTGAGEAVTDAITAAKQDVAVPPAPKPEAAAPSAPPVNPAASQQTEVAAPPAPTPSTSAEPAVAPVPPKTSAPPQAVPSAPTQSQPSMTAAELNKLLVKEYERLGNDRAPIDTAMREMGVQSVNDLKADQYQQLLDKVRAIPAPATA